MKTFEEAMQLAEQLAMAPVRNLAKLVQSLDGIPGDIVEVGCFRGGSAIAMAAAAPQRRIVSIDTFEGLPDVSESDGHGHHKGQMAACKEEVLSNTKDFANIQLVGCDVTRNEALLVLHVPIAMLFLDCDLYESYRSALRIFWPSVAPGGLAVFDDYLAGDCPGATKAVDEFFAPNELHQNFGLWTVEK